MCTKRKKKNWSDAKIRNVRVGGALLISGVGLFQVCVSGGCAHIRQVQCLLTVRALC